MAVVDLTLGLEGNVSLDAFGRTAERLHTLVTAIAEEQPPCGAVTWHLAGVALDSGAISIAGECGGGDAAASLRRRYLSAGRAVARGANGQFSSRVRAAVHDLAELLDGGVDAFRFETATGSEWAPRSEGASREEPGCVTGPRVAQAGPIGARFSIVDDASGQTISCYLDELNPDLQRVAIGRRLTVHGLVAYRGSSDCPIAVREVEKVELHAWPGEDAWEATLGLWPQMPGDRGAVAHLLEARKRERALYGG